MKPKIIAIEGFDRIGKDSILTAIEEKTKNDSAIKVFRQKFPENAPDYRENVREFEEFLVGYYQTLIEDLEKIANSGASAIVIARLLISDAVYSRLFSRKIRSESIYDRLFSKFDIHNIVLLFNTYRSYLDRLRLIGDDKIEYNEEEFNKLNQMFVEESNKFEQNGLTKQICYFEGNEFPTAIPERILKICNKGE